MAAPSTSGTSTTTPGVAVSTSSGPPMLLHPLVIVNISDHYTRTKVETDHQNPRVIGALLGTQSSGAIEIVNSFELIYDVVDGQTILNLEYFQNRREQFLQVFKTFPVVGWYATGAEVIPTDLDVHRQVMRANDGEPPIFLLLDPRAVSISKELPISIFESEMHVIDDEPTLMLSKSTWKIETADAERVAVDHVALSKPVDAASSKSVAALERLQSAIRMLMLRIRSALKYLQAVETGVVPADPSLLRQLKSICALLPTLDTNSFKQRAVTEYNDSMLQTYLATLTKGATQLNDLVDHYNATFEKPSRRRQFQGY